jgi:hypothetical protein
MIKNPKLKVKEVQNRLAYSDQSLYKESEGIFIPFNVSSSKNSKRWTGKALIKSVTAMKYVRLTARFWIEYKKDFIKLLENKSKPYKIGLYFIRDSKRRFDYINAAQLPLDLMQTYGWLEDDDSKNVVPIFEGFHIDKEKAGLIIKVL